MMSIFSGLYRHHFTSFWCFKYETRLEIIFCRSVYLFVSNLLIFWTLIFRTDEKLGGQAVNLIMAGQNF